MSEQRELPRPTTPADWAKTKTLVVDEMTRTPAIDSQGAIARHYEPSLLRRYMWYVVLPLGQEIVAGQRPYTEQEGTAATFRGAQRAFLRRAKGHLLRHTGVDPHAAALRYL